MRFFGNFTVTMEYIPTKKWISKDEFLGTDYVS